MKLNSNKRIGSSMALILIVFLMGVAVGAGAIIMWGLWSFGFLIFDLPPIPTSVTGSGNLITREMDFSNFQSVEVGWTFKVDIVKSSSYRVSITADDNVWDYIQASQTGETLTLGLKQGPNYRTLTLRAEIEMPDINELRLSGATRGTVKGFGFTHEFNLGLSGASSLYVTDMSTGDLRIEVSGASVINGDATSSGNAQLDVSGASAVELEGTANDLAFEASGASNLDLSNFRVNNANVGLSGASSATINLDGRLDADLSGASHLLYLGTPTLGDVNTSGESTVDRR